MRVCKGHELDQNYQALAYSIVLQAIEDYKEGNSKERKSALKFLKSSLCDLYLGDINQEWMLNNIDVD